MKSQYRCPFIRTRYFCSLACFVITNAFRINNTQNNSQVEGREAEVKRLKAKEGQYPVGRSGSIKKGNFEFPMAPSKQSTITTDLPKCYQSVPKCNKKPSLPQTPKPSKKKTITELKLEQDLSTKTKKVKIHESTKGLMAKIQQICESEGENCRAALGDCSLWSGKENFAQGTVKAVFDLMVDKKGVILGCPVSFLKRYSRKE